MLETAEYEFKDPAELNDNEILHMLTIADDLSKWAEDVYSYAQAKAINEGKSWSGFKIVEGRSKRQYVDENKIAEVCRNNGYFKELLGDYIIKPKGRLTLVPETDKREEVHTLGEFRKEF